MKLGGVLSACNDNPDYYELIPSFVDVWQNLLPTAQVRIIFVTRTPEALPHCLVPYTDYLVPIMTPQDVSSMFVSQFVRILYPALWRVDGAILTTDIDMLPMNTTYFTRPIAKMPDNSFVVFRPPSDNQIYICYTAASQDTWRELTDMRTWDDVLHLLRQVYLSIPIDKRDRVGDKGWFTDQLALYQYVMGSTKLGLDPGTKLARLHILSDVSTNFRRLDRGDDGRLDQGLKTPIVKGYFSDYHMHRPYRSHAHRIQTIVEWVTAERETEA
jgi:hypothetical protein